MDLQETLVLVAIKHKRGIDMTNRVIALLVEQVCLYALIAVNVYIKLCRNNQVFSVYIRGV